MKDTLPKQRLLARTLALSAGLGLILGCQDLTDIRNVKPFEGVVYKLNYQPAQTQVQGLVVDAKTGQTLMVPVRISLSGKDAGRAVTFDGKSLTEYTATIGEVFIGLKGRVPTASAPAELRVVVSAQGYIPSSVNLKLLREFNDPFTIRLVKQDAPPAGVATTVQAAPATANGTVTTEKKIEVVSAPTSPSAPATQTTVTIPPNTQLKDDKGQPVTGNVQTAVAVFSGTSQEARQAFPGGLTVSLARDERGQANVPVTLNPAVVISVIMTNATGQNVSQFSQPIFIRASIPDVVNPASGKRPSVGTPYRIFSYSERSGAWTYERDVTVERDGSGFFVNIPVTHLSAYLAEERTEPVGSAPPETCSVSFKINGAPAGFACNYVLNRNGAYLQEGNLTAANLTIPDVPKTGEYELILRVGGQTVATYKGPNPCAEIPVNVTIPANLVTGTFTVRGVCENGKNIEVYPSVTVYYRPSSGAASAVTLSANFAMGKGALTNLLPNTAYTAKVYVSGGEYVETFQSQSTNFEQTITYTLAAHTQACKQ